MIKKEADIFLVSYIKDEDAEENNTVNAKGVIERTDRGYKISFSEMQENTKIDTVIFISQSFVRLTKTGGIESDMHFRRGVLTRSEYSVSGYVLDCDIYTKDIILNEDNGIVLDLNYELKIGGVKRETRLTLKAIYS